MLAMKKYSFILLILSMLFLATTNSCKNEMIIDFGEVEFMEDNKSIVKIYMTCVYPDDRYMYVKFNDVHVTPLIRASEPYPEGGYNTRGPSRSEFLMVHGGDINVKTCMPKSNGDGQDSLVLYSTNVILKGRSRYTFH